MVSPSTWHEVSPRCLYYQNGISGSMNFGFGYHLGPSLPEPGPRPPAAFAPAPSPAGATHAPNRELGASSARESEEEKGVFIPLTRGSHTSYAHSACHVSLRSGVRIRLDLDDTRN